MFSALKDFLQPVLLDARLHRNKVVIAFFLINMAAIAIGITIPKTYSSFSTVYISERNILGPLLEGAAVQTGVRDRATIAQEIIYGRKFMTAIIEKFELAPLDAKADEFEKRIDDLRSQTIVANAGRKKPNLIEIEYRDSSPELAFKITQSIAEGLIAVSTSEQLKESQSAFQFINQQVKSYEAKLKKSEEELKIFREENETVRPGSESDVRNKISKLRSESAGIEQAIKELRIRSRSLRAQMQGERAGARSASRIDDLFARKRALEAELDAMLLSYFETYPGVVRLRTQIAEIESAISFEQKAELIGGENSNTGTKVSVSEQLRKELYDTNIELATLESRLSDTKAQLVAEIDRGRAIPDAEAELAELTREYEVTKQIYEDLLRRREIARVSVNVDREQKGLMLRIDEPAFVPYKTSGFSLPHALASGLVLGLFLPLGFIFGVQKVDGRLRLPNEFSDGLRLPVLGVIPVLNTASERFKNKLASFASIGLIIAVFIAIASTAYLRHTEVV